MPALSLRGRIVIALAVCAIGAGAGSGSEPHQDQGAGASQRATPPAAQPAGTGIIAGTVTAGDSGRPLRRVRVTLQQATGSAIVGLATTDLEGRFGFSALADGAYLLKAQRAGYLEVIHGQKEPGSGKPGLAIPLAAGQRIDNLALTLPRGAVISGIVTDEVGEPMQGVPVRAMKYNPRDGEPTLGAGGAATTDDRGSYRIALLPPGEYIVVASPRDELVLAARLAEEMAMRARQVVTARAASAQLSAQDAAALQARTTAAQGPAPPMPKESYVPVYFPGTLQLSAATRVAVDIAEERASVDIQVQLSPIATVSGRVTWTGGRLPAGNTATDTSIVLSDKSAIPGSGTDKYLHAPANGRFSFEGVAAGEYTIWAQAHVPMNQVMATDPADTRAPSTKVPIWAMADVTVTDHPITNLTLALTPGYSVSGRVVVEPGGPALSRIRVRAQPVGYSHGEIALSENPTSADGRFTVHGLTPGRYRIIATIPSQGTLPMRSAIFGGRDTLDVPLELGPGIVPPEGVITVIPRMASITGQLQNQMNQPVTSFTVIAFAADQRFWTPSSRRIQTVRPSADGRFSVKDLPPGDYRVVAVTDVAPGQWFDPVFLRELLAQPYAVTMTLTEGETRDQVLRVGGS